MKLAALSLLPVAVLGATYPAVSMNCTADASKAASWTLRNFTFDTDTSRDYGVGTAGKVSFSIKNSANGYEFECLQGDGSTGRVANRKVVAGKVWYSCNVFCPGARGLPKEDNPPLATSFHFDPKTKALSVNQTWECGAGMGAQNYTGTGTTTISDLSCSPIADGRADQVSCKPVDVTVKASSVGPAKVTEEEDESEQIDSYGGGNPGINPFAAPVIPKPAVVPATPGCAKMSQNTTFAITDFFTSGGSVTFNLKNTALDYTQRCSVGGGAPVGEGAWFNCTRFDANHVNYPQNEIFTRILYGGKKNTLGVNQTWYCADEDAAKPTVFSVYGEVNFPLKCVESKSCILPGQYDESGISEVSGSSYCNAANVTISSVKKSVYAVSRAQATEDFKPKGYNCTARSLGQGVGHTAPTWDVIGLTLNRTLVAADKANGIDKPYSADRLEFWYNNTATDNEWPRNTGWRQCLWISDGVEGLESGKKQECMMSFEPFRLGFSFDNKTSTLALSQGWNCDGIDEKHTNFFQAQGSVPLILACTTAGVETKCVAGSQFRVPMHNVTSYLNNDYSAPYVYIPPENLQP